MTNLASTPFVSIIICTYNNSASLKVTVQQILDHSVSEPQLFELIVINNNCSDDTEEVLRNFRSSSIQYNHYIEPKQGVSHARNLGMQLAKGEYILFTDDDADIRPLWLDNYLRHIRETQAEALFGKIEVIWDQPKPWWYDERLKYYFAAIDYGDQAFQVQYKQQHFYTKNSCIKKSFLIHIGGFDPELGRKGSDLTGGEEIKVLYLILQENLKAIYFPDVTIGHRLKPREYTAENIKRHYVSCAKELLNLAAISQGRTLAGRPLGLLKEQAIILFQALFLAAYGIVSFNRRDFFFNQLRIMRATKIISMWIRRAY